MFKWIMWLLKWIGRIFKLIAWVFKRTARIIIVLLLVGSLALNVAILTIAPVALLASNIIESIIDSTALRTIVNTKPVYSQLRADNSKLIAQKKDLDSKLTNKTTELTDTNTKLKTANSTITKQSDELAKLGGKVKDLEISVAKKSDALAIRNKELKFANNKITQQGDKIITLDGKVKTLEASAVRTATEVKRLKNFDTLNTNKLIVANRTIKTLQTRIRTPSPVRPLNKLAQREAIENTSNTVISKSLGMVSRNALSVPAQAIPIAGVAVLLGVTALDIKASCDIVNELEQLKTKLGLPVENNADKKEFCGLSKEEIQEKVKQSPEKAWEQAKQFVPDLPDISSTWETTKEFFSPTKWWNWIKNESDS